MLLTGKLALITGAGGGIGRAACQLMSEVGAKVIAVDANLSAAKETVSLLSGDDHCARRMDVSNSSDVAAVFDNIKEKYYSPPNVIVNVAGILKDNFLLKIKEEDFQKVLDVNLKGTFLVTQKACQHLAEAGLSGSIINIASIVAKRGNLGQCTYASSKAGVVTFSKCVALEMAKYNIRCNVILPGFISTSMTNSIPEKVKTMFTSMIPLKRFGKPEEIGEVIKFLASDQSSYITGTSLEVTGGFE